MPNPLIVFSISQQGLFFLNLWIFLGRCFRFFLLHFGYLGRHRYLPNMTGEAPWNISNDISYVYSIWLLNIAMENHHFLIGEPSINGPSIPWRTVSHNQRVWLMYSKNSRRHTDTTLPVPDATWIQIFPSVWARHDTRSSSCRSCNGWPPWVQAVAAAESVMTLGLEFDGTGNGMGHGTRSFTQR